MSPIPTVNSYFREDSLFPAYKPPRLQNRKSNQDRILENLKIFMSPIVPLKDGGLNRASVLSGFQKGKAKESSNTQEYNQPLSEMRGKRSIGLETLNTNLRSPNLRYFSLKGREEYIMNSYLQSQDSYDIWGKHSISKTHLIDSKADLSSRNQTQVRLAEQESRNEIASRRASFVFKERSKLGSEIADSRLMSEDQNFKYNKAAHMDFSAIFDENRNFLYGRSGVNSLHRGSNGLSRRLSEADRLLVRETEWTGNPFHKRDHLQFEKGVMRMSENDIDRSEIVLRHLNNRTARFLNWAEFHHSVDDLVLNRHRQPSKKLFLKEQKTFFLRRCNYFRHFNPILFDKVVPSSEIVQSQSAESVSRTSRKKNFIARSENGQKKELPESLDQIKRQMGLPRHRINSGIMSLNKVDGVKRMMADLNGKMSCSKIGLFEEDLGLKINDPILCSRNDLTQELIDINKPSEFHRRLSIDIGGKGLLAKRHLQKELKMGLFEVDKKQNAQIFEVKVGSKEKEGEFKASVLSKSIEIGQVPLGEMKLTPAKNISTGSLFAYETPIKERITKNLDEVERTSKKAQASFVVGQINMISPSNFPSFPDILNSKNLKLLKKDSKQVHKKIENKPTIRKARKNEKKKEKRKIVDTLILMGPPRPQPIQNFRGGISGSGIQGNLGNGIETENQTQFDGNRCFCKVTKCLKRYCSCFSAGRTCGPHCECTGCANVEGNPERERVRARIKKKDPHAFDSKVEIGGPKKMLRSGCRCTNTKCQKKYCECFRNGVSCGPHCKCKNCENGKVCHSVTLPNDAS